MMTDFEKRQTLKQDSKLAVQEGFDFGLNNEPTTSDGGKFIAYRYVLDKINAPDEVLKEAGADAGQSAALPVA